MPPETDRSWIISLLIAEYLFFIIHVLLTIFGPCTAIYVISYLHHGTPTGSYGHILFVLLVLAFLAGVGLVVVNFYGRAVTLNNQLSSWRSRRRVNTDEAVEYIMASGDRSAVSEESEDVQLLSSENPFAVVSEVSPSRTNGGSHKNLCSSKQSQSTSSGGSTDEKREPDSIVLPPIENEPQEHGTETDVEKKAVEPNKPVPN